MRYMPELLCHMLCPISSSVLCIYLDCVAAGLELEFAPVKDVVGKVLTAERNHGQGRTERMIVADIANPSDHRWRCAVEDAIFRDFAKFLFRLKWKETGF
jgi:hypothetical protein